MRIIRHVQLEKGDISETWCVTIGCGHLGTRAEDSVSITPKDRGRSRDKKWGDLWLRSAHWGDLLGPARQRPESSSIMTPIRLQVLFE